MSKAYTGLRYNAGKPEMSMVLEANKAMEGVAKVLMYGRDKYTQEYENEWEGLLAVEFVESLDLHEIKECAEAATKSSSSTLIQSTKKGNLKTPVSGEVETENGKQVTKQNEELSQIKKPCKIGETLSASSRDMTCQKTYITSTYPLDALSVAPINTFILITTILQGSTVAYCVANTTTVLASLETTLQVLKEHYPISKNVSLLRRSGRGNWLKGLGHMGIVDCLLRHLTAHTSGEDKDAESGLPHVDHVLANALFLSQMYHTRPDLDDRAKL